MFCNFLLADEINRAPAKVQSALLEVMQERQVTIGHTTHAVPEPFLVMATQNPIESEGTYPLPEAQIDRFMLKILIGYPSHDEELTVVQRQLEAAPELRETLTLDELRALQRAVFDVYVDPGLISYSVTLANATRDPAAHGLPELAEYISYGASPRGPISLVQAARALALMRGRDYVLAEDLHALAKDAFRHRLVLSYQALAEEVSPGHHPRPRPRRRPRPSARPGESRPRRDVHPRPPDGADSRPARPRADPRPAAARARRDDRPPARAACSPATTARRALGDGTELAQIRAYQPGDDVRRIDWNVTARTGEPHVRVHLAERVLVTWLVLDTSPSMQFGTAERRKADVLEGVAIAVGHLATRRGNRLGAVTFGDGHPRARAGPPGPARPDRAAGGASRRAGRQRRRAASARPRWERRPARRTSLARQRSLVVIASDFRGPRDWRKPLLQLAARHEVVADRDPRPARAGAAERGRALAGRPGDRPPAARRHAQRALAPPLRRRRRGRAPRGGDRRSRRSACAISCSRPRASGCGRSPSSCGGPR